MKPVKCKKCGWIDELSEKELRNSYNEWKEAKKGIEEATTLTFEEWLEMEKDLTEEFGAVVA